jgi:hypothetical protein
MNRTTRRALAVAIGLVLACLACVAFLAIRFGPKSVVRLLAPVPHPAEEYPSSAVANEIAALGVAHGWAGKYFRGNGFTSEFVCIAPQSGFYRWHSWDYGPPFSCSPERGSVQETEGVLHLAPASEPDEENGYKPSNDFVPVSWGERRYLIPPDRVQAFCRAVAHGGEPRSHMNGDWLLRCGDEKLAKEPVDAIRPSSLCR